MKTVLVSILAVLISLIGASVYAQTTDMAHEGRRQHSMEAQEQPPMGMHGHPSMRPDHPMSLSSDQRARVQDLRRKFIGENAQLIGALVAKRLEFHSLWTDPKADPNAIIDKGKELASLQAQFREKVLRAMVDARSFLTPEQITHLKHRWSFHHRMMGRRGMMGRDRMMGPYGGMMGHGGMMDQQRGGMVGHGGMMGSGMEGHSGGMMNGCCCGMMGGGGMEGHGSGGTTHSIE